MGIFYQMKTSVDSCSQLTPALTLTLTLTLTLMIVRNRSERGINRQLLWSIL